MDEKKYYLVGAVIYCVAMVGFLGNDIYDKYKVRKTKKRIMEADLEDAKQKRDLAIFLAMIQGGESKEGA